MFDSPLLHFYFASVLTCFKASLQLQKKSWIISALWLTFECLLMILVTKINRFFQALQGNNTPSKIEKNIILTWH